MNTNFKWLFATLLLVPKSLFASSMISYDIIGLHGEVLQNALNALKNAEIATQGKNKTLDKNKINYLFSQGNNTIKNAMQPFGYFAPSIHTAIEQSTTKYTFHYRVNPGPSVNITQLKIQLTGPGKHDDIFKIWRAELPLRIGQTFVVQQLEKAKNSFFTVANNNGYIKAKLKQHKTTVNLANYSAAIKLHFATGKKYFYGPIHFSKVALKPSFLHRFLKIKSGDPYSLEDILLLKQDLMSSGYFKSVTVETDIEKPKQEQIPLNVKLKLQNKMHYLIGAGYGTDTGYRAKIGWQWRRINSSGHRFDMQYNVSQIGNSLGIDYYIPGNDPLKEQHRINANHAGYHTKAGKSQLRNVGFNYNKNKNSWQTSYGIVYQYEKYQFKGQQQMQARLLIPSITFGTNLKTDGIPHLDYSSNFSLTLKGASKYAFSDINFAQFRINTHHVIDFNENNRLLVHLEAGETYTRDYRKLPLSLNFTAGGPESVRGYTPQSLGPGKYLLSNSFEYQHRIKGNWYAAIFHDTGNAFNNFKHANLQRAGGIGLMWESPIGTMQLDLAKSISKPEKKVMVQFNIGVPL